MRSLFRVLLAPGLCGIGIFAALPGCAPVGNRTAAPAAPPSNPTVRAAGPAVDPSIAPSPPDAGIAAAPKASVRLPEQVNYTICPGDELRVAVLGHGDLSFKFRVPSEGLITFPLIGEVRLTGRSTGDIEKELRSRLEKDYLVDPQVSLFIESYSKKFVYVFGGVKESKAYELPEGQPLTLTQVISMAGGFSPDAAKNRVRIIRRGSGKTAAPVEEVDVTQVTEEGNLSVEAVVGPADVVVVPSLKKVYVLGQVQKPGGWEFTSDRKITVTQAISLAGGFTAIASERNVRVLRRKVGEREQQVIEIDVWSIVQYGQLKSDMELEPGDIVFVPESVF